MKTLEEVARAIQSKKKGDAWVSEFLPVVIDINRQIKAQEKAMNEEAEPFKAQVKSIADKYAVSLNPLHEIDKKLRARVEYEHTGSEPISADGIGQIIFPEYWDYKVVDLSKVPKEFRMETVNDKLIREKIKGGIRNIKGLVIEKIRSMRVLTKTD